MSAQANAMRSPQEKNTRLENMTWRIWNLARKKKEVCVCALLFFLFLFLVRCVFSVAQVLRFCDWVGGALVKSCLPFPFGFRACSGLVEMWFDLV